ncbi:MAG: hypothetical protein KJ964_02580, partial [Verrucomicrobia bacterium]|nr:hypothetical protein [Verrucomicrobiota bacterium]MBU1734005.1 hypothetical protein [Verrucomicrobiota bacterium]MBU1856995.1 hypothetical protein [Verrucomicrobiota bacterium]
DCMIRVALRVRSLYRICFVGKGFGVVTTPSPLPPRSCGTLTSSRIQVNVKNRSDEPASSVG